MHRQVGDLMTDERSIAQRGLLVRHLVLPEELAGTAQIASFLAAEISADTYINIMDQYRPCYQAGELPPLNRRITRDEYRKAVQRARQAGLHRFDRRERRFLRV
jgi:putative pyruvate formate lyase activating enzyme